jgi:hypothetical protein
MQPKPRLHPRSEHHPHLRRHTFHQELQAPAPVRGVELVEVVDDQQDGTLERLQIGEQPLDHRMGGVHGRSLGRVQYASPAARSHDVGVSDAVRAAASWPRTRRPRAPLR